MPRGVAVSDEELDNEVMMLSIQTREPYETLRERLAQDGGLGRLREEMRREKTSSVLYEKLASVETKQVSRCNSE